MDTTKSTPDESLLRSKRKQNLQEMLREVGLAVEYWLPKLQEHLGVTCAQSLQHLEKKDLQKLKSQAQHPWEKRALEKLLNLSQSDSLLELQESQVEMVKKKQKKAEQVLQELRNLLSERKQQQEEAVRKKEKELRQAMEIPKEYWPPPEKSLQEVMEDIQRQLNFTEGILSHRENLSDKDLVRWASGGLALQGIYKTSYQREHIEKTEELLSVPKEFLLFGPEQGTRMETKEFTSFQAASLFTKTIEKLGFSVTASANGEGWGFSLETGTDHSKHSESKETHQSRSEHSYFCSLKFNYVPLASCHFPIDQLQFSKAALQELKCIEDLLGQPAGSDSLPLLRHRTEAFFHRFGSHANQGPLQLGGIYWWKAISEGFRSEQLAEVKEQSAEFLNRYIRGSYSGFQVKVAAGVDVSDSHSKSASQSTTSQNLQIKVQLSVAQTGGPPEANSFFQWKAGLVASNKTWCVIDRGLQLVPIWDIILSSHRSDFKDPLQIANFLKDSYNAVSGLTAQIQAGEELLSASKEARVFLKDVKSWEVSNPEEQLKTLMNFKQMLNQKIQSYDTWVNICLTDRSLQNFLVNTVNFCKESSIYKTKFIKSQLSSLLDPHIYKVTNFPQAHSIMRWIFQSETEQEHTNISQFSELIKLLKETQNYLMGVKAKSESTEIVEEAQRKVTYEVSLSLGCFLNYLQKTEQPDIQLLLLSIAAGAGYHVVNNTFQYLLGCAELDFLLDKMQTAQVQYQELKNICTQRAQAFLVLTVLTATVRVTEVSPEEKTQRLALIRYHMGQSLSKEVACVLTRLEADHNWENLEKDLRFLIDGNYEPTISSLQMDEVRKNLQSIFHEKKQPHEPHDENTEWEVIEDRAFPELLQRLGLKNYYPKKMSRANFQLIYKASVYNTQPRSEEELPFYFLQKLMMLDYGLRYLVFRDDVNTQNQVYPSALNQENKPFDPYEDSFEDSDPPTNPSATNPRPHIHPMDIQMAILHCADDFARQYILTKLSICQFALPLLIPNPCNSEIEFSLWSLSQIRRSWQEVRKSPKEEKNNYKNKQMCHVSAPIVSFIRVGNGFSASKSQIMNCLLSKRKYDVFFHRHCRGSSKDCLLMGGVVEVCWFCPGGEDEDRFDKCLTFTNLHGNAKEYEKQLSFLKEVSSLIVVLMSTSDDNKENRKIVRDLSQSPRPLICLLDNKEKTMANNSNQKVMIGIRNRNEAELTEELTTTITRLLKLSDTVLSLEDCTQIAHKQGFLIDEDQGDCKEAKEKAETVMALLKHKKISQVKENLLPLQGQLWHLWCKKDKELYHLREKGNRSIEQHKSEIEAEKQRIRCQQLTRAFPLNELMQSVLLILRKHSETQTSLYFLQWLSAFLDNLTAGHLEKLNEKKKSLWSEIQTKKQTAPNSDKLKVWQDKIEALSIEISDCTLGIEQFLREAGQIYEALEETNSIKDILLTSLPQIAADLMISGVPIELMDGDASYVPLKWVAALFDKVSEKLGNKRLFVLSILGLQSSGKSTLLNALFGLQLTVSAGRCTQGAYMQLLKVEETFTDELGFDFVLVVDTEGLRAPELRNESNNHDNELATFVIGLGNLTLINIFGENPSEMQDILQIVVQAFMRMKQVKLSPSCFFVHQNVGEVTAKDQTIEGRRRLEQRLDEMTAIAAEQEQCSDITHFSDVIKFDVDTNVYYFAHLWDGNPPMAPPNPRYSHNVQELRRRILMTAKQESRGSIMRISDVKFRVQDLWRALVNENFIFSFRNTREVMAMSKLETIYNHWTWELRSHVLGLQNQLINHIQNGKIQTLTTSTLEAPVTEKYEAIKQELEKYFNEDQDSEILIQWKASFENKLLILKEALILDSQRKVKELISFKKSQETLNNKKSVYEKELLEKSRRLALTIKGKELSETELHEKFNELWEKWVYVVSSALPPATEPNINVDSESILLDYFKKETNIVTRLRKNSGKRFLHNFDEHVKISKKYHIFPRQLEVSDQESIKKTTKHIVSRFLETLENLQRQQHDYNPSYFHKILRIIEEEVQSDSNEKRYTFTSKYKIDLSLDLFQRASENFMEMHRAFKRANDPVNYLKSKKDDFFMSFKISCQGATSIKTFVDFLWHKLTPAASTTIWEKMVLKIAGEMRATCPEFNENRANLEKYILISLAEKENFDDYWEYLHDPESLFRNYIENRIKIYADERSEKMKTLFKISFDDIKNAILLAIHQSTAIAKDKSSTVSEWLDLFCDHLGSNLIFPREDLISIEHQEIKDYEFLKEAMSEALDPAMKTVEQKYLSMPVEGMVPEIQKMLSEHLCGCWKQCPFCGAICTNTIPNHDGDHSVPFHRPIGTNGWRFYKTEELVIDYCTSLVASDLSFILSDLSTFPYKNYRQAGGEYATWSITPDSSTQPYWKWFVCHFRSNLEEKYQKKFIGRGEIPHSWAKITKQDVLDDLKKQ
ncbi:interferon-induced very large GTPase 1-like [Pteropus medius]|uniref:interferon-induced very large GTPase 1-like n=1 Tax=Pteropus vampyrus TaxID=132908 RepID=UPI00196A8B3C|nr:interferon-induced very large GTPase 1-like [Pteropus giganteus]XP_039719395.1 interferon-induced very large GTPase 1-like [Pteropus giganteus]XP_039719396.1 interferon-induced very large GTPase 1-like [Pteropus giganteus]XP_039719397.1 interferon-induced very large GTPase 1-like [Pteropus giganteus]XP_039719398.1 interferon-induced very large GTPase 1-like [Pteropus giganteus]XP_039719399.1 interferon-induced very large GTPase 1-like [Pteropus giganteus]XP_039719400.1 interferon-induced v